MLVAAGASGALFGIVGALGGYLVARRDVTPGAILQLFSPPLLIYLAIDSLLGLLVPEVDGAAHIGGLITGFACGLAFSRPWPPPPAVYAPRRRLTAVGLLACGLAALFLGVSPGIRARLERDPDIAAYYAKEKAERIYNSFLELIEPGLQTYDALAEEFGELTQHIDQRDEPAGMLVAKLDRLISRAGENGKRLGAYAVEDPGLRLARDRVASAQVNQHHALVALRRYLERGDPSHLTGIGGFEDHLRGTERDLESYRVQCEAYLKANGLGNTAP
jgi:rhomboid protease GluP